jgi:hypothetical protein
MMASCPAIATASPGPCVSSARAKGDRWESVPRDGSASSSPKILKLCSRPSSRRSLTVKPKDVLLLSSDVLTTSALARRAPQYRISREAAAAALLSPLFSAARCAASKRPRAASMLSHRQRFRARRYWRMLRLRGSRHHALPVHEYSRAILH